MKLYDLRTHCCHAQWPAMVDSLMVVRTRTYVHADTPFHCRMHSLIAAVIMLHHLMRRRSTSYAPVKKNLLVDQEV